MKGQMLYKGIGLLVSILLLIALMFFITNLSIQENIRDIIKIVIVIAFIVFLVFLLS